jgi:hypothetical protein
VEHSKTRSFIPACESDEATGKFGYGSGHTVANLALSRSAISGFAIP